MAVRRYSLRHEGTELITFDSTAEAGWGGFDLIWNQLAEAVKKAMAGC